MVKQRKWLITVVAAVLALAMGMALVACGGKKLTVTWTYESAQAEVLTEDGKALPTSVKKGAEVSFTAKGINGYEVVSVKANGATVRATNGVYKTAIDEKTEIVVETAEKIRNVTVTAKPTKLVYIAGEEVDKTGMTVEVEYETDRKETVTDYSVIYNTGSCFVIGDESFKVRYNGVTSETVALDEKTKLVVAIDPDGGAVSDEYIAALREKYADKLAVDQTTKVVTISYAEPITEDIVLPVVDKTKTEVQKGLEGDYTFRGWKTDGNEAITSISKEAVVSVTCKAEYEANLVTLSEIKYELRKETVNMEDGTTEEKEIPYLIIKGEFKLADSVNLYLYEGNDEVEFNGPTIKKEEGATDRSFELLFNMRTLADASTDEVDYMGKWMDIKFVAELDKKEETMAIDMAMYGTIVDKDQIIHDDKYKYLFATYTNNDNGITTLKALYNEYVPITAALTGSLDKDGVPELTIAGVIDIAEYFGKQVAVDIEVDGKRHYKYANIGEKGAYTLTFTLDKATFPTYKDMYMHFAIVEPAADDAEHTVIWKDGNDGNFTNTWVSTDNLEKVTIGLIENSFALKVVGEKGDGYYIGYGKWGGLVLYGIQDSYETFKTSTAVTSYKVAAKDGKAWLEIKGTYDGDTYATAADFEKAVKTFYMDWMQNVVWTSHVYAWGTDAVLTAADGVWTIEMDITDIPVNTGTDSDAVYFHFGVDGKNYEIADADLEKIDSASVTVGGKQYEVLAVELWGAKLMAIKVTEAPAAAE